MLSVQVREQLAADFQPADAIVKPGSELRGVNGIVDVERD